MKLSDAVIKALPTPASGNKITYDDDIKGFGVRVTKAGAKAFILNYRTRSGLERRYTIGSCQDWKYPAAREEAKSLKKQIDVGADPMGQVAAAREAKTMADLCDRFEREHLTKKRDSTARDYRALVKNHILPALKNKKVAEVEFTDIDGLHRKISKTAPYLANRTVSVLSKMFGLAIKWKWRHDNPAKGVERNDEQKRHRYLSPAELAKLTEALTGLEDQQAANIFRLLLLTGARRGEVQAAKWEQFDLTAGVWTKPGSTTKQKTMHRVPLSAPARLLLTEIREKAKDDAVYVFPGRGSDHRVEIKAEWRELCLSAGIVTAETVPDGKGGEKIVLTPSARIHDLRHTYASVLASSGLSLPIIGALLGHSQPATTARYSHLMDDPLRQATERVGSIVMAKTDGAEVKPLKGGA
ncbi:site-specific integrase [Mesorhizobium sp. M1A.T.Ca.IN.004.03.1.1]|uniref:tyrosine-type recombinase/integrase n=1 Tax=Mesorhizobium sp. M1A.T.Ca.IN.004.03.1.1 TaxID=2496795 RepID=UPI000FCBA710|nr:site-specific integrase [Mesorhizobium sp. M1A.T.Ca.IN.004.03.1.1]RUV41392.1 site-specific integrase [Mesorhizobium sp. M1A.T.Ca.IN.004.03.1.1]